jgi:Cu-Zn family superoxide dismutase
MKTATFLSVPGAIAVILAVSLAGCGGGGGTGTGGAGGGTGGTGGGTGGTGGTGGGTGGTGGGTGGSGGSVAAKEASATIEAKSGSTTAGTATFTIDGDMVTVKVDVTGVDAGVHAVHIHDHPDCSSDDGMSAMGHWNPTMKDHGKWGTDPFHLGDIGNMTVGADGTGSITLTTDLWTLGTGDMNDVVGHAIMIHADPDDFVTQPTGMAGARIGCGVITAK